MFNFGFSEVFLIFIVALIVFGPNQLPEVTHKLGTWLGYLRRSFKKIQAQVEQSAYTENSFQKNNPEEKTKSSKDKSSKE